MSTTIETTAPAPRPIASRRRELVLLFGGLLLLTVALRMPAFFVDVFNSDETFLATQAEVINDGGDLYADAADRKPPLVPYLYALTFAVVGSTALWSVRVLAMVAVALTGLFVAIEARDRYGRRAGWIAGALCVMASVAFAPQDGQAANFEVFMLPALAGAVLLARRDRPFSSGVAVAVATLAKQTGAATLLPVLYLTGKRRGRQGVWDTLLGFAAPLAIVALAVGPGELLFWTTIGNGSYLSIHGAWLYVAGMFAVMTFAFVACNLPIVWTIPRAWRERTPADWDLWLWVLSAAISVAFGLRFFGHYYFQLLPPLSILTAGVLVRLGRRAIGGTVALAVFVAVGFSVIGYFARPFDQPIEYERVSSYIAAHTTEEDRIFVWGHQPEIYWASGRHPATRFPTTGLFTGDNGLPPDEVPTDATKPLEWDLFYEDFAAHPPRYFLDTSRTDIRGAQYYPPSAYPRLARLLYRDYDYVTAIDGIDIYERKPTAPPPSTSSPE
jgi:MFS family permease